MPFIKVADHPGLVRDTRTGAILNTDQSKAAQANAIRQKKRAQLSQVDNLNSRVENLENNIETINSKLDALIDLLKSK